MTRAEHRPHSSIETDKSQPDFTSHEVGGVALREFTSAPEILDRERSPDTKGEKIKHTLEAYLTSDVFVEAAKAHTRNKKHGNRPLIDTSDLVGYAIEYSMLFPDDNTDQLDAYIGTITKHSDSPPELNKRRTDTISDLVAKKLGIDPDQKDSYKEQIARYVYDATITEGFVFHGFNSAFEDSITMKGLSGAEEDRSWEYAKINQIDKLFADNGIDYATGLHNVNSLGVFFVSETPAHAYHYATTSPEWFSIYAGGGDMSSSSYEERDYDAAKAALTKRMESRNFPEDARIAAIGFLDEHWSKLAEGTSPRLCLIPKHLLDPGVRFRDAYETLAKKSPWESHEPGASDVVRGFLTLAELEPNEGIEESISPEHLTVIALPDWGPLKSKLIAT